MKFMNERQDLQDMSQGINSLNRRQKHSENGKEIPRREVISKVKMTHKWRDKHLRYYIVITVMYNNVYTISIRFPMTLTNEIQPSVVLQIKSDNMRLSDDSKQSLIC